MSENETEDTKPVPTIDDATREVAGTLMGYLIQNNEDLAKALSAMITSRHLYVMARNDLEYRIERMTPKEQDKVVKAALTPLYEALEGEEKQLYEQVDMDLAWGILEEFFALAAAGASAKEFNEKQVLHDLGHIDKWLHKVSKEHDKWEASDKRAAMEAWEKARRERNIPLPFEWCPVDKNELPRLRSLVFYGWAPALRWLSDQIVAHVLSQKLKQVFQIIRLSDKVSNTVSNVFTLTGKAWEDCCRTGKTWPLLFQTMVMPNISEAPDLLVVDDIAYAGKSAGLLQGTNPRKGGAAHRRFRQWCNDTGCAFLGFLPMDDMDVDFQITDVDWEQLRNYSALRAVQTRDMGENYLIKVGENICEFTVDKKTIDDYMPSKIVVP